MRLGLFGGTFDPPHAGHLAVARAARDLLALDRVELIPTRVPPHRQPPAASAPDRFAMVALAVLDEPRLVPSPREIVRDGVSYTVETLRRLEREHPEIEPYLVLGLDSYLDLPHWKEPGEIVARAHLVIAPRPGATVALRPEDRRRRLSPGAEPAPGRRAVFVLAMDEVPLAATELRAALARGERNVAGIPGTVLRYIRKRGLYGMEEAG